MIDGIKKTLIAGFGAAGVSQEKVEAVMADLVRQGKVTAAEARQVAEKIAVSGRREFDAVSHDISEKLREKFAGADRQTLERIAALEARVAALELAAGGGPRVPTSGQPQRAPGV